MAEQFSVPPSVPNPLVGSGGGIPSLGPSLGSPGIVNTSAGSSVTFGNIIPTISASANTNITDVEKKSKKDIESDIVIPLGEIPVLDNDGLTQRERFYFNVMKSCVKGGALFITGRPGVAKSAITKSIAKKLGYRYIDVRLSHIDATDLGFPRITTKTYGGIEYEVMYTALPDWAVEANLQKTIIHFEELNRAPLDVRNACLQIINEREIGSKFQFNDNVLMVVSGNLGEEDDTDVEEFDSALNSRLIHVAHNLSIMEWISGFAKENVHDAIVRFVMTPAGSGHFYKENSSETKHKAFACPRSWTFLSNYIIETYGKDSNPSEWISDIERNGVSFVGSSVARFIRFLQESMVLSVKDIVDNFPKMKKDFVGLDRSRKSELLLDLHKVDIPKLSIPQVDNIVDFLSTCCEEDEIAGFMTNKIDQKRPNHFSSSLMKEKNPSVVHFMKRLHKYSFVVESIMRGNYGKQADV